MKLFTTRFSSPSSWLIAAQLRDRIELIEKQDARRLGREIEKSTNIFRRASEERRNQAVEARNVQIKAEFLAMYRARRLFPVPGGPYIRKLSGCGSVAGHPERSSSRC